MDRRQIGFKLTMDALGRGVTVGSFEDRLILQKAMYLAQAAGVQLGYFYRWYLYGPYCPQVADDAFAVNTDVAQGMNDAEDWELDAESKCKLARIRNWMEGEDRDVARTLELLASVHFLLARKQVSSHEPGEIGRVLRKFDKQFSDEEVEGALGELRNHDMLP